MYFPLEHIYLQTIALLFENIEYTLKRSTWYVIVSTILQQVRDSCAYPDLKSVTKSYVHYIDMSRESTTKDMGFTRNRSSSA